MFYIKKTSNRKSEAPDPLTIPTFRPQAQDAVLAFTTIFVKTVLAFKIELNSFSKS